MGNKLVSEQKRWSFVEKIRFRECVKNVKGKEQQGVFTIAIYKKRRNQNIIMVENERNSKFKLEREETMEMIEKSYME